MYTHTADAMPIAAQARRFAQHAAAALAGTAFKTTGQPVRRDSRHAGERERRQWKTGNVFSAREKRARLKALKRFERCHKERGRRNGLVGHVAIELYELLLDMRDYKSGRLDPTLGYLASKLKRSIDAICKVMKRLDRHGFLRWDRRTIPVDNLDPRGPQVQQTSNAYWFDSPAESAREVRDELASDPMPEDEAHRYADQAA
jgi:hypothetical protein